MQQIVQSKSLTNLHIVDNHNPFGSMLNYGVKGRVIELVLGHIS